MVDFELLVAGHCVQLERFVRRGGAWSEIEFPSTVGVVRHPRAGVMLFDTGYAPRFHAATARMPYRLYARLLPVTCSTKDTARAQLGSLGIGAEEVGLIVLSHLHADHVAGLRDFPQARVALGERALPADWRIRSPWVNARHGFVPSLLPDDVASRLVPLGGYLVASTGLGGRLRNGHDVFGDGSAFVLPLPGHVDGHLGMWLPELGPDGVFLVGDACWSERAFTNGELPHPLILRGMEDRAGYLAVIEELSRLHRERPDLLIVPAHCSASIQRARGVLGG